MKALTIGSAMIDTIALIDSNLIEQVTMTNSESTYLLLEPGLKTEATAISAHCGGGAVNAAVAMSRLGAEVGVLARVGTDERAEAIFALLAREGISAGSIRRDELEPTGASVIISAHERNAAVFTFRGANTRLDLDDVAATNFDTDLVYVSPLSNAAAACFPAISSRARAAGAFVAVNPGIRQLSSRTSEFLGCLPSIDLLTVNRKEAGALLPAVAAAASGNLWDGTADDHGPLGPPARNHLAAGGYSIGIRSFLRALSRLGPKNVVITDGRHGSFAVLGEAMLFCPAEEVETVGTTVGAGDAFAATLAFALVAGFEGADAVRAATINAASVTMYADTQTGLLALDALTSRVSASRQPAPVSSRLRTAGR